MGKRQVLKGQVLTGLVVIGLLGTLLLASIWITVVVTDKRQQDTPDVLKTEETAPIPEPASFLMFGSGCLFWWATRREK